MGNNPSRFEGKDNPVEQVSWFDAQTFVKRLNEKEGHNRYRLPTEAEWEYAARAGTSNVYYFGDDENELSKHGWYRENSEGKTHPVGQKLPNPLGLYDIYGNVYEWVEDWLDKYSNKQISDPKGPSFGSFRVLRGGAWDDSAGYCRSASRWWGEPKDSDDYDVYTGLRLAFTPE